MHTMDQTGLPEPTAEAQVAQEALANIRSIEHVPQQPAALQTQLQNLPVPKRESVEASPERLSTQDTASRKGLINLDGSKPSTYSTPPPQTRHKECVCRESPPSPLLTQKPSVCQPLE